MLKAELDARLQGLSTLMQPLEKLVLAIYESLPKPLFYDSGIQHFGFRYGNPDHRHFCLLKAARAVSALNASIELVRCGYTQELYVLLRTVVEFKSHIEYVLSAKGDDGELRSEVREHIGEYFADYSRAAKV